ncbi:MAG: hypothetical protein IJT73_05735 [Selenomonadaceae bacterium]|nr:hypothetical protein [Selenomonadaceae bacterium]
MKITKKFVGAAVLLALFINAPQVSADDVETFGADFDDENSAVVPFQRENSARDENDSDDEDLGGVLIFNNPAENDSENPLAENPPPEDNNLTQELPKTNAGDNFATETPSTYDNERILPPSRVPELLKEKETQKKVKTQKARFIKLAVDDTYTYYLDKQSVAWRRVPYSAGEYMIDVWVRMIELEPDTSDLPEDLADYINDKNSGEIEIAKEKGIAFAPVDVDVLQHKKYFLEHYYLRPRNKQIQFLCELEVVGHPQNTVSERAYDYRNWEYLIPGSIESIIYNTTMKEVGKSGSSEHGHMSFADYLEEYARISIR